MRKNTLLLLFLFILMFSASAQGYKFEDIKISKNPVTDNILEFESEYKALVEINIYNIIGQNVFSKKIDIKNEKYIDISNLYSGIYLVRLQSGYQKKTLKIIKN